ncbi:hypothetical protein HN446_03455 [bacterium]|jgi:hypothetical protein|nr:hypothetical protein [bacterium]
MVYTHKKDMFFFFLVLNLFFSSQTLPITPQENTIRIRTILDESEDPTTPFKLFLSLLKIQYKNDLESLVKATQEKWLRPKGKERWQIEDKFSDKKDHTVPFLNYFEMIKTIQAKDKEYEYVIILGAYGPGLVKRISFFLKELNRSIKYKQLVFLTSARKLVPDMENTKEVQALIDKQLPKKNNLNLHNIEPTTETEMAQFIFDQIEFPNELQEPVTVTFVDTPLQKNGHVRRANTADTLKEWLITNPQPGSCLFISNQPFVMYQDTIIRKLIPKDFIVETIGPEIQGDINIWVCLDSIARTLYSKYMY